MRQHIDELEEENSREKSQRRKFQREIEDLSEIKDSLLSENSNLKAKLRRSTGIGSLSTSRLTNSKRGSIQTGNGGSGEDLTILDESIDGEDSLSQNNS